MTDSDEKYEFSVDSEKIRGAVREHPGNPSGAAEEFIDDWDGNRVFWRGDPYKWAGDHWKMESWPDVEAEINTELKASVCWSIPKKGEEPRLVAWSPNNASLANLEKQLRLQAALPSTHEPARGGQFVFMRDGRYDPMTGTLFPHDRDLFNLYCSPVAYEDTHGADCPEWDGLLKNAFDGDQDSIDTHYLWMAAELINATDLQKIYYLTGPKRTGKGVMLDVGTALIGEEQVTGLSLGAFSSDFGLEPLLGKSVCRIHDSRSPGKNAHDAVERLLVISGGGRVAVNRKGVAITAERLRIMFSIDSNLEVNLPDASGAIMTRMVFNRTANSMLGHEDFTLSERIIDHELPGVMRKVLEYVDQVYDKWPENPRSAETRARAVAVSQPLSVWAEEVGLKFALNEMVATSDLYESYATWCAMNDTRKMDPSRFGVALGGMGEFTKRKVGPRGDQVMTYIGVGVSRG